MSLNSIQEKLNKRLKAKIHKKRTNICIPKKSILDGSVSPSGKALLHKTKSYIRVGKMKGSL